MFDTFLKKLKALTVSAGAVALVMGITAPTSADATI